jgi:hypothetical protein
MDRESSVEVWLMGLALVIVLTLSYGVTWYECDKRGGALVNAGFSYECVEKKR